MFTFFPKKKEPINILNNEKLENMKLNLGENYVNNKTIDFFTNYYKSLDIHKYFKIPLISLLIKINIDTFQNEIPKLFDRFNDFNIDDLENIEIIFLIPKDNPKIQNTIKRYSSHHKKLSIIKIENNEKNDKNLISQLIQKAKGKFVTLLNDFYIIKNNLIYQIYNSTNGKINNIYDLKIEQTNKKFYIIKTKILKDIFDNGNQIKDFNELISYIHQFFPHPNINNISIAFCIDNNYILNAYVSIISILENKNYNTYISFYILISKDFHEENINLILSLYEQYDLFNITFYRMDDRFDKVKMYRYITKSDYFKLSLGEYLSNLNKIIYLDCDVIVYKDLVNLYEHNFNDYLLLALPTVYIGNKLISKDIYYNGGVLLLNLKKMREIEFNKKVLEILDNGFTDTYNRWNDQAILNKFFYEYIGNLEPEYNSKLDLFAMNSRYYINKNDYFNLTHLIYSEKYPSIYHFTGEYKPFEIKRKNSDDWWFFAKKGKYLKNFLKGLNKNQ